MKMVLLELKRYHAKYNDRFNTVWTKTNIAIDFMENVLPMVIEELEKEEEKK